MSSILQSIKDQKRRITQKMKNATHRTGRSSDEEMEKKYNHYNTVKKSLEVLMEQCKNLVKSINAWSESNRKIGEQLHAFVSSSPLLDSAIMEEYRVSVVDYHTTMQTEYMETRRAVTAFLQNRVINVIERLLKEDSFNVEAVWKVRKNILLDYESHLRRASNYEQKKDMEQMNRFELKASHDQTMLEEHTRYLNQVFDAFMTAGSDFLLFCTSSFLTCEMVLVKQQFESLASICNNVGEATVSPILEDIDDLLSQIRAGKAVEKASAASLPFILPPKEAIPKYVPFREYMKMETVEKSRAIASSISDGEMDGVREESKKEEVKSSDVFGLFDGHEDAKGEDPGDDVFGDLMSGHQDHDLVTKESPLDDLFGGEHTTEPESEHTTEHDFEPSTEHDFEPSTEHDFEPSTEHDFEPSTEHDFEPSTEHDSEEEETDEEEDTPLTDNTSDTESPDDDSDNEESSEEDSRPSYPRYVIARASFEGDDPEDLSFNKGDVITVLKVSKSGWWKGKLHGRVGIFPATFVRRYN